MRAETRRAWAARLDRFGVRCRITPPADVSDPTTIYLLTYVGMHASLLLPHDGGIVEWTYGDWKAFATEELDWYRPLAAMFVPSAGGLGRRAGPIPNLHDRTDWVHDWHHIQPITLSAGASARLLERLERQYAAGGTVVVNSEGISFVRVTERYYTRNTCNHVIGRWLTELGCEVHGANFIGNYTLVSSM